MPYKIPKKQVNCLVYPKHPTCKAKVKANTKPPKSTSCPPGKYYNTGSKRCNMIKYYTTYVPGKSTYVMGGQRCRSGYRRSGMESGPGGNTVKRCTRK